MPDISLIAMIGAAPTSGIVCSAYKASRFAALPVAYDTAVPGGVADATATSGIAFGGPGQVSLTVPTFEEYWVAVPSGGHIGWVKSPLTADALRVFEGQQIYAYGHSFIGGNAGSFTQGARYVNRLLMRLRAAQLTNSAVSGSVASDALGAAISSNTGTTPLPAPFQGLVVFDSVTNDAATDRIDNVGAPTAGRLAGHLNSVTAFCYLVRALAAQATIIKDTNAAVTYPAGAFTAITGNPQYSSGTNHYSGSTGAQVQIAWDGAWGSTAILMLLGWAPAIPGGTAQVKVDGVTVATVSTASQSPPAAHQLLASNATLQPVVVNMTAGNHTILITNTGAGGTFIGFDSAVTPVAAGKAPLITLVKDSPVGVGSSWGPGGLSPAQAAAILAPYNANLDTAAALFPAGEVLSVDCFTTFDAATMACALDGVHPNDHGHSFFADQIEVALQSQGWRMGVQQL